jgi:hypothetical protein
VPGGPSFSDRPNYRRRRLFALLLGLGVLALAVVLLTRGGGPLGPKEQPIPTLEFVSKVTNVTNAKAVDEGAAQAEGQALVKMFNEYYQTAFVDPGKWGDGTFTDLLELFAKDVQPQATKDLPSLTIGEARTELKRVDLGASSLDVTVYYDAKQKPTFAVAAASFSGRGTLKRSGPPLNIFQRGTYYLQKSGDSWTITSYDATQEQATPTPSPTASPSGSPS